MDIIEKLKSLLKEKGIKVNYFASRLDCTTQNIYNIFNGRTILTVEMLKKMAEVLNVDVSYFFINKDELSEKIISNDKSNNSTINDLDGIKTENFLLKIENERLKKEIDFLNYMLEKKEIFINQLLENKRESSNAVDDVKSNKDENSKAKKSA